MSNDFTLKAQGITVVRDAKIILNDISFRIRPHTLTAIIGPNGAGKTTLMRALTGTRPEYGQVLINGQDIYQDPEYWLPKIGYVPVDNILHEHLTLQDAMLFIGRLRLPDQPYSKIKAKVDQLLAFFGFGSEDRRKKQISVLSSGEKKRANICSELIIDPDILMLDEPTSNLDPNAELELMQKLAAYAHEQQKTILVITHTLNAISLCDHLLYIENSRLLAEGKPEIVLNKLEKKLRLNSNSNLLDPTFSRWAHVFEATKANPEKIDTAGNEKKNRDREIVSIRISEKTSRLAQFWHLIRRYTRARIGDKRTLIGTLLAGLSGVLFFSLPGEAFIRPLDFNERVVALNQARQSVYVIALVVSLLGMITTYSEISKEFRIYSHERLKGLSPSAYFLSKWVWLSVAVGVLAPILLLGFIVLVYQQPLPDFPEPRFGESVGWIERLINYQLIGMLSGKISWMILGTLILCCIASVTIGLLISSVAGDSGRGYLYLSFTVVFIVLFSGLIHNPKLEALIDRLSILSTGKWAYEGIASSISLYCWIDSWRFDEFNSTGHLISIWISLSIFTLIGILLAIIVLHLRDPWYRGFTNLKVLIARNWVRILVIFSILILLFSYTAFLRDLSRGYHDLNYWSRSEYGGNNAYIYANLGYDLDLTPTQYLGGLLSQSWCGGQ